MFIVLKQIDVNKKVGPTGNEDDSSEEKIEALAEIIYRAGDEAAAVLFVLMGTLEHSAHPKLLGLVDAQLPLLEGELLADRSRVS